MRAILEKTIPKVKIMNNYGAEIKVGLFVLIGIIILSYMSLKVGKFDFGKKKGYSIDAYFDNVSGLNRDVPVEIAGIEVGSVDTIQLDKKRARVTMNLNSGISIPSDSRASIRTKGIMGDKFIEITPGTKRLQPLKDGDVIGETYSPAGIDELIATISDVAIDIKKVSSSFGSVLGEKDGESKMKGILENLNTTTESLNRMILNNEKRVESLLDNFYEFSKDIKESSRINKEYIHQIVVDMKYTTTQLKNAVSSFSNIVEKVDKGDGSLGKLINDTKTIEDLNRTLANLRSISEKIDSGQGTIGRLISKEGAAENLDKSLASLRNISEKIDSGQGTIGKLINDDKMAENLEETMSGINDYFTRADAFNFNIDFHLEQLTRHSDTKSYLNLKIQPKADKYYLLGLVSDTAGLTTTTDTVITEVPGSTTTTHKESTDRDKLKFNAQIAKRYKDFVFRGGVFESTGGLGLDYLLYDDRFKLSLEAFDFDSDSRTHLKFGANLSFLKYLYLTAGFDDFISDEDESSFFVGAGLRFEDDDIKYLLTNAPIPTQ